MHRKALRKYVCTYLIKSIIARKVHNSWTRFSMACKKKKKLLKKQTNIQQQQVYMGSCNLHFSIKCEAFQCYHYVKSSYFSFMYRTASIKSKIFSRFWKPIHALINSVYKVMFFFTQNLINLLKFVVINFCYWSNGTHFNKGFFFRFDRYII